MLSCGELQQFERKIVSSARKKDIEHRARFAIESTNPGVKAAGEAVLYMLTSGVAPRKIIRNQNYTVCVRYWDRGRWE